MTTRVAHQVSRTRLQIAVDHLHRWVDRDDVPGVSAVVLRQGQEIGHVCAGNASWDDGLPGFDNRPTAVDTLYYLASITKPVTAMAGMLALEEGSLLLSDTVTSYFPAFAKGGEEKRLVLVRHLLTHTSGLPDMLPENVPLREQHASLDAFAEAACRVPLLFPPGTQVSYSSAGLLMLARIVELVAGERLQPLLARRLFAPLELHNFTFHLPEAAFGRVARLRLPARAQATDWDNNSPYWRRLGAPWGGIFATVRDTAAIGQYMLEAGFTGGPGRDMDILSPATIRLMTTLQTAGLPTETSVAAAWGLGWALGAHWMGDLATSATFGHIGASGTMLWVDPPRQLVCCVLTNKLTDWQAEWRRFAIFSTAMMAAVPVIA